MKYLFDVFLKPLVLLTFAVLFLSSCFVLHEKETGEDSFLLYSENKKVKYIKPVKKNGNSIRLATWNIGHFSMGSKPYSTIDSASVQQKSRKYKDFIEKTINADIIGINEYSNYFFEDKENQILTRSILFDGYRDQMEGPLILYTCNSLFSNVKCKRNKAVYFESNRSFTKDSKIASRKTYYIESELSLCGEKVILVCVHVLFSRKYPNEVQQNQIKELMDTYANTDRVIIIGDFNTGDLHQFKKNGFVIANDGSIVTYPSKKYALDNIVAKGIDISNVYTIETELSDHFPLVCEISIIKNK